MNHFKKVFATLARPTVLLVHYKLLLGKNTSPPSWFLHSTILAKDDAFLSGLLDEEDKHKNREDCLSV